MVFKLNQSDWKLWEPLKKIKFNNSFFEEIYSYFSAPKERREFIISPVNKSNDIDKKNIADYIKEQTEAGISIYYPRFHTFQEDNIGLTIMNTNLFAISEAGKVSLYFNKDSVGSIADLGAATYDIKKFEIINTSDLKYKEPSSNSGLKTIHHPLHVFAHEYLDEEVSKAYEKDFFKHKINYFANADKFEVEWNDSKINKFELGIMMMTKKPIYLKNKVERTETKSHTNVIIELDKIYRSLQK